MIVLKRRNPCIKLAQAIAVTSSNVLTIAAAEAGDLIITAHRWASTTIPTPPSGYTDLVSHGFLAGMDVSYIIASGGETSITHPSGSTDRTTAVIYRGARISQVLQVSVKDNATSATIALPSLTLKDPGRSWVVGVAGTSTGNNAPSTTATQRTGFGAATTLKIVDSNGPVQSWSGQTISNNGSVAWAAWSMEVVSL